jgi:hypothetical protein
MKITTYLSLSILVSLTISCSKEETLKTNEISKTTNQLRLAPPSDFPRAELANLIENVTSANGIVYNAKDDHGHSMDCAKIIANPSINGEFIAVYHSWFNGVSKVNLATSTNLLNWKWIRELAGSGNGPASQPTIAATANNAFVLVWEQENGNGGTNHLKFVYFDNWTKLKNGSVTKSYDAPRTLSNCAEGTPNIYFASASKVEVGYHYFQNCFVDRQARGTTNWTSWSGSSQGLVDNALLYWGAVGNIGDRDCLIYNNFKFGLFEGQTSMNDFGSFRSYLYDYQTGNADKLNIITNQGSQSFGNSTFNIVNFNNRRTLIVTHFIFSENSGAGEAGELIYYKYF